MSEGVRTSLSISNEGAPLADPLVTLERLPDGAFAEVEVVLEGDAESLIVYRDGDHVRAWLNICPHAGRRLDWAG